MPAGKSGNAAPIPERATFYWIPAYCSLRASWPRRLFPPAKRRRQVRAQPPVSFARQNRLIIHHIIDLPPEIGSTLSQKKQCGHDVITMRLVDKAIPLRIEDGFAREKCSHKKRTARSINSGKTRHDSVARQNKLFGLAQNAPFLMSWIRRTGLVHDHAMLLGVDARAAGENQPRMREKRQGDSARLPGKFDDIFLRRPRRNSRIAR